MKAAIKTQLILLLSLVLSGCLVTRSQLKGDGASEQEGEVKKQVVTLQQKQAQEELKQQETQTQFRSLHGRVDKVEADILKYKEDLKTTETAQGGSKEETKRKLKIYQEILERQEKQIQALTQVVDQLVAANNKAATAAVAKKPKLGNYSGAEVSFKKGDWKNAILGYQKYREMNPKGKRYADATYKIGVSFQELKEIEDAKIFYGEVVEKFPGSNSAKKAKYRLSKMK